MFNFLVTKWRNDYLTLPEANLSDGIHNCSHVHIAKYIETLHERIVVCTCWWDVIKASLDLHSTTKFLENRKKKPLKPEIGLLFSKI